MIERHAGRMTVIERHAERMTELGAGRLGAGRRKGEWGSGE
jgi:hypothetical protein